MVPKTFYEDYPFKTRDKGVILGTLIKKGNALNKKFPFVIERKVMKEEKIKYELNVVSNIKL